ncbi:MAG: hypothetical protein U9R38_07390 [Candidatus Margulisiibacteriota bacterium]|nr:hypothetical protein [Candidatus Margulisiibacteriota bacterium]
MNPSLEGLVAEEPQLILPLTIASTYDASTNTMGGITFAQRGIDPYAVEVDDGQGNKKRLPDIQFYITDEAKVICSSYGTVIQKYKNPNDDDYEILIQINLHYKMVYDHVTQCPWQVGDSLKPGDIIGYGGPVDETYYPGVRRVEWGIRMSPDISHIGWSHNPVSFLTSEADKQLLEQVVQQANALGYGPYTGIAYLEKMSGR